MNDSDKNEVQNQCWKTIFITIALLVIGAAFGHIMTVRCCPMMRPFGGPCMKAFWDRGEWGRECGLEHKFQGGKEGWFGHKADFEKCKPGCTCPKCSKKGAGLTEPDKAGCPKKAKKECKSKKF